eukprot:10640849-Alexandrium_andersonii.AAC.1
MEIKHGLRYKKTDREDIPIDREALARAVFMREDTHKLCRIVELACPAESSECGEIGDPDK